MAHQLILTNTEGIELGRRAMEPQERYHLYQLYNDGALFSHEGKRYTLHSVAWRIPDHDCVLLVSFDSYEPVPYCDG
jgi:hypothetical protein